MTDVPTPVTSHGSSLAVDGHAVHVKSGPAWIVQLAFNPPHWLGAVLTVLALLVAGACAWAYYRRGLDRETVEKMSANVIIICSIMIVSHAVDVLLPGPYIGRLLVGWLGGFGVAKLFIKSAYRFANQPSVAE